MHVSPPSPCSPPPPAPGHARLLHGARYRTSTGRANNHFDCLPFILSLESNCASICAAEQSLIVSVIV